MHEQAAHNLGLRCHYQLIEVAGADREELRALLDGVRRLGFAGVNITFPCKEAVVDLLDELSPDAANMVADSNRGSVTVIGAGGVAKPVPLFSADLWSVTVFCGIGLLVSLVAIGTGDKDVGFGIRSAQPAEERRPSLLPAALQLNSRRLKCSSEIGQSFHLHGDDRGLPESAPYERISHEGTHCTWRWWCEAACSRVW